MRYSAQTLKQRSQRTRDNTVVQVVMATLGQANKGHWIGVSTAEETGAKFFDGKGNCSWSAMLRCRHKFAKRLVGQPWREFVKGESTADEGVTYTYTHTTVNTTGNQLQESRHRRVLMIVIPTRIAYVSTHDTEYFTR